MRTVTVIGMGPAGIGAAIELSRHYKSNDVLLIDSGLQTDKRGCHILTAGHCLYKSPCHVVGGFGGSMAYAGGKLSGFPAGTNLGSIMAPKRSPEQELKETLDTIGKYLPFEHFSTSSATVNMSEQHFSKLGLHFKHYQVYLYTQIDMIKSLSKLENELRDLYVELKFETTLVDMVQHDDHIELILSSNNVTRTERTRILFLGLGRTGRLFMKQASRRLSLSHKPRDIQVGLRLEFPTDCFPDLHEHHGDLKLIHENTRTYCATHQGNVLTYLLEGIFCVEGDSSQYSPTMMSNFALLSDIPTELSFDELIRFIKRKLRSMSGGKPVYENLNSYLGNLNAHSRSETVDNRTLRWASPGRVSDCYPRYISDEIKKNVTYYVHTLFSPEHHDRILVYAPELGYWGDRYEVDESFRISDRVFLIGECTGQFRGIAQSWCSGRVAALELLSMKEQYGLP